MYTKSIKILLTFFLISSTSFSQNKNHYVKIKVSYNVNVHLDKNHGIYKVMEKYSPGLATRVETIDSEIDFSLVINDFTSIFYMEKKLFSDNRAASSAIIHSGYFGRIKQETSNYITEELQENFGKFLVSRSYQKWKLHDDTKQIGDYLCFKATTFHTTTNSKGKVFKHNFTAWYTPQIPYKFGPAGYGNLPGLIIQLQGDRVTYGVKKIQFYNEEDSKKNKMPKLRRKKLITEEKFEELAAKDEERWRNKNK